MLYRFMEYQRAMFAPFAVWAANAASAFSDQENPLSQLPGAPAFAAGYDMLYRLGKAYDTPGFGIAAVEHNGCVIPVVEQVVRESAFCRLLRFAPDPVALGAAASHPRPAVLVCAPLAGHHAVMLREVVETLLPEHLVYVTDWVDARCVPLVDGPFHLDDYVTELQTFIRQIGAAEPLHVIAICQATVPALAAISLLASAHEPTPRSLTLMGGPIDARRSPTAVGRLAADHSLDWFQRNLIYRVPDRYAGAGRKVCPNFLQLAGLMAAQPGLLLASHWDYYLELVQGDHERAEALRRVCDAYHAVLDMAAEFYLETIQIVFQEFRLARGDWFVQGQLVRPQDIRGTKLLTIEGDRDAISGCGQTQAAHGLCQGITACDKRHVTARRCSHYELFRGPRWHSEVYPDIRALTRQEA
jgi:poly(3-hydroxybutyrate) depolymerase